MEFITPDASNNVRFPNRAARYTIVGKRFDSDAIEDMGDILLPDGAASGRAAEIVASGFLAAGQGIATTDGGVISIEGDGVAFSFTPMENWRALNTAHRFSSRYTMEIAQYGHADWTPGKKRHREMTAGEVRALANKSLNAGGSAAVSDTGVILIEEGVTAVRLTPVVSPGYRRERWSAPEVGKYLRSQLRKAFPGHKISVRNGRGTGYGYLHVSWTGGPSEAEVEQICDPWQGGDFDGMTDMMVSRDPLLVMTKEGELIEVKPITELINYTRSRPAGVEQQAKTLVQEQTGHRWDHAWPDTTPFRYQGVLFYGSTPWDQLRKVMDAIEAGEITVKVADPTA
ncbi:LPD29 domain-containing protein [Streptomyces decoyicus]|uniref:LPD29 domain-containing protein n=1 Tax=Streptomyces decoyicus TaxID=249567 RepID=UPI0036537024